LSATREQAFLDAKSRIKLVQTARWVGFNRAQLAVDELERRYHYPSCARMPCMLLYGDSGMGKTMILEKMERQHPSSYEERRGITLRPVVSVQMPPSPDERRFYTRMLEVLGAPYSIRDQIGALEGRALDLLKKIGTKLLFIDDAFRAFIVAYGKLLPLRKASCFGEPAMIQALIKHSSGVTGRVTWLLGRAAERAIEDGREQIIETDIERVSERLRIAAA
jgi:hypothetical protein